MTRTIRIPPSYYRGRPTPEATVVLIPHMHDYGHLYPDTEAVWWEGERIGFVWKGERTYSPPVSTGSRVAKYHKQIPEWQGGRGDGEFMNQEVRADRRWIVIANLIGMKLEENE